MENMGDIVKSQIETTPKSIITAYFFVFYSFPEHSLPHPFVSSSFFAVSVKFFCGVRP